MTKISLILTLFLLYCLPMMAKDLKEGKESDIEIVLDEAPEFQAPIAIGKFINKGTLEPTDKEDIQLVITNDLLLSGFFNILPKESYLVDFSKSQEISFDPKKIPFQSWATIKAMYLIMGWYSITPDGGFKMGAYLYDVIGRQTLLDKSYSGKRDIIRRIAHRFSDLVIKVVTGEPGICETQIAFVSTRNGKNKAVYIMDYDGENIRLVSKKITTHLATAWNRNGTKLAYIANNRGEWELQITEIKTLNTQTVQLPSHLVITPEFSPVSDDLILVSMSTKNDQEIFAFNPNDTKQKPVALTKSWNLDLSPSFSPDGEQIAYVSSITGNPQIFVMKNDGSSTKRITFDGKNNETPVWSPKGDKIAFGGMDKDSRFDIFVMKTDGTEMKRLTYDTRNNEDPNWSPDGRWLVFSSNRDVEINGKLVKNKYHLYIMKANGKNQKLITHQDETFEYFDPAWSPRLKQ